MDCVGISPAALKTGFFMGASSPAHYLHHSSSFSYQAEEAWASERGAGLVGGDEFFVDDLLDFGGAVEEEHGEEGDESERRSKEEKGGEENASKSGISFEELATGEPPLVPVGDICDLEWVSQFVDDSIMDVPCSALVFPFVPTPKPVEPKFPRHCHSPSTGTSISSAASPGASAISSCMRSSSRTWSCFSDHPLQVPSKPRSKRCCRASSSGHQWSRQPHFPEPLCSSSSSCSGTSSLSSCLPLQELGYHPDGTFNKSVVPRGRGRPPLHKRATMFTDLAEELRKHKKKKGRKPKTAGSALSMTSSEKEGSGGGGGGSGRVCSHCGVSKTPQWRAGPMGSKTLCNACGVRYKSGRLLPEYRPASSPTFVSHVHSNSHRKVLEMRRQKDLTQQQQQLFSSESDSSGDWAGQSCSDSSETPAADTDGSPAPPATLLPVEAMVF